MTTDNLKQPDTPIVPRTPAQRSKISAATRVRGVFNGTSQRLAVQNVPDGFEARWFNDEPGRLDRAQSGGWRFAKRDEVLLIDTKGVVERNADMGDRVAEIVGTRDRDQPLYAYLMLIPKEWAQEDRELAQQQAFESERAIREGKGLNVDTLGERAYVPKDRKKALTAGSGRFEDMTKVK